MPINFNLYVCNLKPCYVSCCSGCKDAATGAILKKLFQTPYFRITVVPDAETVELCGALKVVKKPLSIGSNFPPVLSFTVLRLWRVLDDYHKNCYLFLAS